MVVIFKTLLFLFIKEALSQGCVTKPRPRKPSKPCVFPFRLNRITYDSCTTVDDPEDKLWCATATKANGDMKPGQWGYCEDACIEKDSSSFPVTFDQEDGRFLYIEDDGCGKSLDEGQIVGGKEAKIGEFPFMALLGYKATPSVIYKCGGTLINRRYVISAAHCQTAADPIVEVMLGQTNLDEDPECKGCAPAQKFRIRYSDVKVHEEWNVRNVVSKGNDIILIRLPKLAMTYTEDEKYRVRPVCLAYNDQITLPTGKSIVAGWGRNTQIHRVGQGDFKDSGAYTPHLLKVDLPVMNGTQCKKDFPIFEKISEEKHICAGGEQGKDSCSGDSGGPLLSYEGVNDFADVKYLRGIVSFGAKKCGSGIPGVFTNIEYYMEWILKNLKP